MLFRNPIQMSAQNNTRLNPVLQSHLDWMVEMRTAQRQRVAKYRDYEEGDQTARLTANQLALFPDGKDPEHNVNICPIICNTISDRIKIKAVDIPDQPDLADMLNEWWRSALMDDVSSMLHYAAARDGDAYLLVSLDDKGDPVWTCHYQDDGTTGVDIAYDDGTNEPLYATKRWQMTNPDDTTEEWSRLNVYYHDRVEKYINYGTGAVYADANWQPYLGDSEENPAADTDAPHIEWWTEDNSPNGTPLGLPMVHFPANAKGNYGRSDLADVVPGLQDQLNDASVDLRIATKFAGAKLRYVFGVESSASTITTVPGGLMMSADKDVLAGEFTESNLVQLVQTKDSIYRDISTVTGIPLANINPTAQIAAEGTLQQQEAPLIAKVEKRHNKWGNRYEEAIKLAIKAASAYGSMPRMDLDAIDALNVVVQFAPAQLRNEKQEAERAILWQSLNVPEEIIWRDVLGMSYDQIEEAKALRNQSAGDDQVNQLLGSINEALLNGQTDSTPNNAADSQQPEPEQPSESERLSVSDIAA